MAKAGLTALVRVRGLEPTEITELRALLEQMLERLRTALLSVSSNPIVFSTPRLQFDTFGQFESEHGPTSFMLAVESEGQVKCALVFSPEILQALAAASVGENLKTNGHFKDDSSVSQCGTLTQIETRIVSALVGEAFRDAFEEIFSRLFDGEIRVHAIGLTDRRRASAHVLARDDHVVLGTFQVALGNVRGVAAVMMPLGPLLQVRSRLQAGEVASAKVNALSKSALLKLLLKVQVEFRAVLSEMVIPFGLIRQWRVGDVIGLGKRVESGPVVDLRCGSVPVFFGLVVEDRGWRKIFVRRKGYQDAGSR